MREPTIPPLVPTDRPPDPPGDEPPIDPWFVAASHARPLGPIDKTELDRCVADRTLTPACQLLRQGAGRWQTVNEVYPRADHPVVFRARSCHVIASDRIYRVEIRERTAYFLRVGGQFNVDRSPPITPAHLAAFGILEIGELLLRKHRNEEHVARDPNRHPKDLLHIHPHNFRLSPSEVRAAIFMPPRWYANVRLHFGCLEIDLRPWSKWRFEFETFGDLLVAYLSLGSFLGAKAQTDLDVNAGRTAFMKCPRRPLESATWEA